MNRPSFKRQSGFTILELVAVLALTGGLIFALAYKTADIAQQRANQNTTQNLALADQHLREFAARVGRLPCPDSNGTGVEDCGVSKGTLPYRTLGLVAIGYQQGDIPIRYGVFRKPMDADLAVRSNHFQPTNADNTTYAFNNRNSLDFCIGLRNAAQQPVSTSYLYQQSPGFTPKPMAYMLAAPGQRDADGINGPYDGLNADNGAGFQSPDTPISPTYDDQTQGRGFDELSSFMRCEVTLRSLDLAANAIAFEEEVIAFAESNAETAKEGVMMGIVGTSIATWNLAQAGAALASAGTTLGISSGLLATVTATCPIPPFLGCALIPVYATAVASAGVGLGLSGTALGLSAGAVAGQIAATIMYNNIAKKTGVPETPSNPGLDPAVADAALVEYNQKNAEAGVAAAEYQTALANLSIAAGQTTTAKNQLDIEINKLTASQATALREQLYGNFVPNTPPYPNPLILGVAPAINAWRQAENTASVFSGTTLVDENNNPIDLNADADAAEITAQTEKNKVQNLSNSYYPGQPNSLLNLALNAYLLAYDNEIQRQIDAENKRLTKENKATEAANAKKKYDALNCAVTNQDYDAATGQCTANPPGTASQNQTRDALCNPANTDSYNATACAALNSGQPSFGTRVEFHRGAAVIVELLDAKGTVQ